MSSFRVLNLRYLRRQPLRVFFAVVALAAAAAGTVTSLVLISSLDRSLEEALKAVSGPAPLRVVGPLARGGLHPSVAEKVAKTPGVDRAVPVVQAVAIAQEVGGQPVPIVALGVDCRVEALVGAFGCDERALGARSDGPVLTSPALLRQAGAQADVRTDDGRVQIEGAVLNDSLDDINGGRIAIFDLAAAQRLFDRGRNFDAVYIQPESGTDVQRLRSRLVDVVPSTNLVLSADEPSPWMSARGPLIPLLSLGLLIAMGISAMLVYNILSLSLADRRRDIAIASSVGTSPRVLTTGIVAEASLLGLVGGALGVPLGLLFALPLVGSFAALISEQATGVDVTMHIPLLAPVVGVIAGGLVAALAAIVPARRAQRLDLAAELHGRAVIVEDVPKRRLLRVGVLLSIGAIAMGLSYLSQRHGAIERWQPPVAGLSLLVATTFVFAAGGSLAPMLIAWVLGYWKSGRGPVRVAMANLVSRPRRTSVIATAVGTAVGAACVLGALIPATKASINGSETTLDEGPVLVATLPFNNASNVDARPSTDLVRRLDELRGVRTVIQAHVTDVADRRGAYAVRSSERYAGLERVMGDVSARALARGEVIVGTGLARSRGLRPGSTLRVATPTGFVPVRVAGIWIDSWENGHNATISPEQFHALFGTQAPHRVLVEPKNGLSSAALARRIEEAKLDPDVRVMTARVATNRLADEIADQASPFWTLQRVLLAVALIGTLSTLLLVGVQRRRELGILGAVGFSPIAVGRMTLAEALAAGVAGSFFGILASLAVFEVLRNVSAVSLGFRTAYRFEPFSAITATALAAVVVAAGAALPAWRASRLQIVEAIRDE